MTNIIAEPGFQTPPAVEAANKKFAGLYRLLTKYSDIVAIHNRETGRWSEKLLELNRELRDEIEKLKQEELTKQSMKPTTKV